MKALLTLAAAVLLAHPGLLKAGDWTRFRGPNGSGVSDQPAPVTFSSTENLKWKAALPGPGSSSPIIVGEKVFLTCWAGYADGGTGGKLEDLKRTLVCLDRETGKELWTASVPAVLPEDSYRGMFAEHGYASHSPVSDGERVYVFFGKSGVHAFDMAGKHLWKTEVGDGLNRRGWGSASSPILYKNLVLVTALVESETLYALDKETGKIVWKQSAEGYDSMWGTPILVDVDDRTELVITVPYEMWGMNPETGKLIWHCDALGSNSMCSSAVAHEGVIYAVESGPDGGGSIAVKAGGKGDVTKTHVLWKGREGGRIGSPIIHDGRIHFVSGGVMSCLDAKDGKRVYQARLTGASSSAAPAQRPAPGRPGGFGGGFGGGGRGGQDYASPVAADGKFYFVRRSGEVAVIKLGEKFEQLATNRFEEGGDFSASPAISDGQLFIRSSKMLYCIAGK